MKKMSSIFGLLLLATSVAVAQDKPKTPEAPKSPVLTDKQQKKYFKANSEYLQASTQAEHAGQIVQQKQTALQEAGKSLIDACGKEFAPNLDAKGDLVCVAIPKPEAKK